MRKRVMGRRGRRDIFIVLVLGVLVALAITVTSAGAALQCARTTQPAPTTSRARRI